jgi:hypothetical protein
MAVATRLSYHRAAMHPDGGSGPRIKLNHSFAETRELLGDKGASFVVLNKIRITAEQAYGDDDLLRTIVFKSEDGRMEEQVCHRCWGLTRSCTGRTTGPLSEALDRALLSHFSNA